MKVFLSYSLSPTDLHIAGQLMRQAQAKGYSVDTSQHQLTGATAINTQAILTSTMVIAIVSRDSLYLNNVQGELQTAISVKKPVLALIERGVPIQINVPGATVVEFDRHDFRPALTHINAILEGQKNQENLTQWLVVGGLALLALYLIGQDK